MFCRGFSELQNVACCRSSYTGVVDYTPRVAEYVVDRNLYEVKTVSKIHEF